jgi:hypothetical protein
MTIILFQLKVTDCVLADESKHNSKSSSGTVKPKHVASINPRVASQSLHRVLECGLANHEIQHAYLFDYSCMVWPNTKLEHGRHISPLHGTPDTFLVSGV